MKFNIDQVMLHKEGMRLIDHIVDLRADQITCESTIRKDNLFYEPKINGVYAWIGVEFIAQAIAAYAGASKFNENINKPPSIGFLLSVRQFSNKRNYFVEGETLTIKAQKIYLDNGVGIFSGQILINEQTLITAKLNTYQPTTEEKIQQVLTGNKNYE